MSISWLLHSYPQLDKRSKIWELNIFSPFLERLCLYAVLSLNRRACSRVQSEWCRIYLPALSQSLKSWNVYHRVTISDCDSPRMPCWGKVECLWKRGRAILWSPYDSYSAPSGVVDLQVLCTHIISLVDILSIFQSLIFRFRRCH